MAESYFGRFFPAFAIRSSIGLREAKPSPVPCQCVIVGSPSLQHNKRISPSTLQGKSSNPMSRSFTCTPVASISARASLTRRIAFSRSALRRARWTTFSIIPPFKKTRCAVSCNSASTSSISFLPLIACLSSDSRMGRSVCASSRVKLRSDIVRPFYRNQPGKERADCSTGLFYNGEQSSQVRGDSVMALTRVLYTILLASTWTCTCTIGSQIEAQEVPIPQLTPGSARKPATEPGEPAEPAPPQTVALTVAKGAPLQVALDEEIRVKKVGQPVHARVVEPVYAFDHIVVPVGSA